jgi:hypothetical protein
VGKKLTLIKKENTRRVISQKQQKDSKINAVKNITNGNEPKAQSTGRVANETNMINQRSFKIAK